MHDAGFVVWFTGLPCSGKSTLAQALMKELEAEGLRVEILDGDEVRKGLTRDLGFSKQDRDENIRRIAFVGRLLARNGVVAIAAAVSPYRGVRDEARRNISRFVEVYAKCPVEVCIQRDVKGMYRLALAGEIANFTGVSDPYEEPLSPEVSVETDKQSVAAGVEKIMSKLRTSGYLSAARRISSEIVPLDLLQKVAASVPVKTSRALSQYVVDLIHRDIGAIGGDSVSPDLGERVEARLRALGYLD